VSLHLTGARFLTMHPAAPVTGLLAVGDDGLFASTPPPGAEALDLQGACVVPGLNDADDMDLALPFIVCAQLYAFHRSLRVGNSPDNPSKSGTVNRVVRGVTIHTH